MAVTILLLSVSWQNNAAFLIHRKPITWHDKQQNHEMLCRLPGGTGLFWPLERFRVGELIFCLSDHGPDMQLHVEVVMAHIYIKNQRDKNEGSLVQTKTKKK